MQIFEGNEYELKQKFSLSPIAVVCAGILRNKNIYLTEPFLELCSKGGPLEGFLKERTLPNILENPKKLQELHSVHDPQSLYGIVLLDEGRRKILALEMEIAAEAGWQKKDTDAKSTEMPLSNIDMKMQGLSSFFCQEEIQKIKVTLATAVHAKEKREAIRKMALSGLPEPEKTILFLHTLADPEREVRSEAANALFQVGFSLEITQAIRNLTDGDKAQRLHSINSLGKLFSHASDLEKAAILQIFMSSLRDSDYKEFSLPLYRSIHLLCPDIPERASNMLEQIMFCALDMMVSHLSDTLDISSSLFSLLEKKDHERVVSFLTREVHKSQDRRLRAFLLVLLAENSFCRLPEEMIARMVFEISLGDELDPIYLHLAARIVELGDKAIPSLLERFSVTIRTTERMQIAKLFSTILTTHKISVDYKNQILKSYAQIFPTSPDMLRMLLLDTALLEDKEILNSIKEEFAREILVDIHKDRMDQINQASKTALCRMKKGSVSALLQVLKNPLQKTQSAKAAEILGDVILQLSEKDKKEIIEWKDFCYEEIQDSITHQGHLFCVLGKIASCPGSDQELSEEICEYLFSHLCKTSYPYILLEGLGYAASSPYTSPETRNNICQLFMDLMNRRLPERLIQEKKQGESKIYEFDAKTSAYTDLLPVLLQGFKRLAVESTALPSLRKAIVRYLLEKWGEIVSCKFVWGPKNTTDLADTLYSICLSPLSDEKDKVNIMKALYEKISIFSITEMISNLLLHCIGKKFEEMAEKIAQSILDLYQSEDYKNPEDREVLLRCIGRMTKARKLATNKKKSDAIREKFLYHLFDGLREQIFGVNEILEDLLTCPYLSNKSKMSIEKRLPKKNLLPLYQEKN